MNNLDLQTVSTVLVLVGAINWGVVALDSKQDLVAKLTPNVTYQKYVKYTIALAGLYLTYLLVEKFSKK